MFNFGIEGLIQFPDNIWYIEFYDWTVALVINGRPQKAVKWGKW
jgi:hypothetical protein